MGEQHGFNASRRKHASARTRTCARTSNAINHIICLPGSRNRPVLLPDPNQNEQTSSPVKLALGAVVFQRRDEGPG